MKTRPILWSAPMVLALLAGRKTQTRRIVKPQTEHRPIGWGTAENGADKNVAVKPYARVGDLLWGRETFGATELTLDDRHRPGIHYRAADDWPQRGPWPWRPSIFMPRWASRLLHEVTAVRVERLQDISETDAIAEGVEQVENPRGYTGWRWPGSTDVYATARFAYLAGWDTINGKGSAATNPWTWVVSFKPVTP